MRVAMTLAVAQRELRQVGIVLTKRDGEYRVNFRDGEEPTAYYTDDIGDAVATGREMARDRERPRELGGNGIEYDADHGGYY